MRIHYLLLLVLGIALGVALARLWGGAAPRLHTPSADVSSPFLYTFDTLGTLQEAGAMDESTSPYFWLNSGAYLLMKDGVGETVQGRLPKDDYWRTLYASNNPLDTGSGYYPQNLFRLVTRSVWGDASEQMSFRITSFENTDTPNRAGYSGVLLFSRYTDGDNLYYAGVRDDGTAVIKKKIEGTYYTLAQVQIFGTADEYRGKEGPSLLPANTWTGLRLVTRNMPDNAGVLLELYIDRANDGHWTLILTARDQGTGGAPLSGAAHAGIRTDYMDVQFENYRIESL